MLHKFLHNARSILVSSKHIPVIFFWICGCAIGTVSAIFSHSEPGSHLAGIYFEHGTVMIRFFLLIVPFFTVVFLNRVSSLFGLFFVGLKGAFFSFSYSYICLNFPYASVLMLLLFLFADAVISIAFVWLVFQNSAFYRTIQLRKIIPIATIFIATFLLDVFWISPILDALFYRL